MGFLSKFGSSIIEAGAGLVGTALGFGSNQSTNKTNMKIAQMNNEFNERMLQKQMDYNTEMWNKQNEYNSASSQVQRLRDAGLNPNLMMDGGSAGTAGSVGGVNPPTATPVTMQPYDFSGLGSAFQNAVALAEQRRVNSAQIDHVMADAQLKRTQQMTSIMDAIANTKNKNAQSKLFEALESTERQMLGANYAESLARTDNFRQQTKNAYQQGLLLSKELAIFDERNRVQVSNMIADTLLKTENMKMSKQERIHEVQKMLKTNAETQGIKLSNDIAKRSATAIVDRAYNDEYWSRYSSNPWQMGQEAVITRGKSYHFK